jgi:hypothetical protein
MEDTIITLFISKEWRSYVSRYWIFRLPECWRRLASAILARASESFLASTTAISAPLI